MNLKCRFKLLVGPRAGEIVEGAYIGAWDTLANLLIYKEMEEKNINLDKRLDWSKPHVNWGVRSDGAWIPSLNCRFDFKVPVAEIEDLHIPFDRYHRELAVGDVIAYAMRDLTVAQMRITKIGNSRHLGCGWFQRTLHGIDLDTNKKTKNSYPTRCIKLN